MKSSINKEENKLKLKKYPGQSATVAFWRLKDRKAKADSTVWPLWPGRGFIKKINKKLKKTTVFS